jgi:cardiolipin synthase
MTWRKRIGIYPWHSHNEVKWLLGGKDYFNHLCQCIDQAQKEIILQVYIFEADQTGLLIIEHLKQAAARGVKIKIWADAYGSSALLNKKEKLFQHTDIEINFFSPLRFFTKREIGIRLHHKIILFDERIALVSGINISNHYSGFSHEKAWLDFGIQIEGEAVKDLLKICDETAKLNPKKRLLGVGSTIGNIKLRVLQNNWPKLRFGISKQYRVAIRECKEELIIMNSYFIPSLALKRLLKKAAKRGVKVHLILGGLSDVNLVKNATHYFYADLLKAGISIYEYYGSILHAKIAFADEHWMCVGSYNLNYLSDFGSLECNVEIKDAAFQKTTVQQIKEICKKDCKEITLSNFELKSNWLTRFRNYLSYVALSFSLRILFLFQKRNKLLQEKE